ncbi:unnamed protein product [Eruca vesicaria subsp. sativa]|uniref:Uncharacterized protein n=1 Tax=Eruca vesicaria subsp. sativa TaxID=29727 RepID=A0ABC8IS18_ERUVS|nr:unnamed protein product [Eruca vesicaria subsp. sativa]
MKVRVDDDGHPADEFLEEGVKPTNAEDDHNFNKTMPRLEAKCEIKHAKVRRLVVSSVGKVQQCIEHQGR